MYPSIIITTYKDSRALELILRSLRRQTYKKFQVIIAEDSISTEVPLLLQSFSDLDILHLSQEDKGRRKLVIQNEAIHRASGKYLIFIDGDCILYSSFIQGHLAVAKRQRILTGRRINLPKKLSQKIRQGSLDPANIEKYYFKYALKFMCDREIRYEQGFYFAPDSFLFKLSRQKKRTTSLLGCNFSCFKCDFEAINGFDEGYGDSIIGQEDTDIDWRFKQSGCEMVSVKNIANMMHLYHPHNPDREHTQQDKIDFAKMQENIKKGQFVCLSGLNKHY